FAVGCRLPGSGGRPWDRTASPRAGGAGTPTGTTSPASPREERRPRARRGGARRAGSVHVGTRGLELCEPIAGFRRAQREWAWIRNLHSRLRSPATSRRSLGGPPIRARGLAAGVGGPGVAIPVGLFGLIVFRCH